MKISCNWLKEYINTDLSPEKIGEVLTDTGLEVEGIEEIETVKGGLKGVVIGEVLTCEPHPNADRLKKTTVTIGSGEPLHIVCGAPNVAVGLKVPVATVGTLIYTENSEFTIKKSKIRGEISEGMICAEDELGLGESHEGIMVLDKDAKVGTPAAEYFEIENDFVFEIGLTPNRTDAMSHYGVARDLRAALLRHGHEGIDLSLPSVSSFTVNNKDFPIHVKIEDEEACPHYTGVSLTGVTVGPSPAWLQNRLRAIGIGPVNNVVDATNYVLHETGHPLHAFDADKIAGNKILVKHLPEGTAFTTLDEKERKLSADDLMICNGDGEGMCIAGVFGGAGSGVNEKTGNVFLEAACFDPVSIRKTAKRHALNTDASFRYERGVDPEMTLYALKRAAILIREIAGGSISMDIQDAGSSHFENAETTLNLKRMNSLIGQEIEVDIVRNILTSLDIQIRGESGSDLLLSIPAYRRDVTREADVVEEVLRIYGFNAIAFSNRMNISVAPTDPRDEARYREKISQTLSGRGFNEIMNNSLTRPQYFEKFGFKQQNSVEMLNPLSQDLAVMRQSLVFGGLETIARNVNRQRPDLKLYEFGKAYSHSNGKYNEAQHLGLWISGFDNEENWENPQRKSSFYTLKAEVSSLLNSLGLDWKETEGESELFDYSLVLEIHKKPAVELGRVSEAATKLAEAKAEVFFADIKWEYVARQAATKKILFRELPKYPEVRRDLALLLDREVKYADLVKAARNSERKILKDINLFDVYQGKNLPEGKKSYALSFIIRDDEKTLNDQQVDKVMEKILNSFKKEFAAELR